MGVFCVILPTTIVVCMMFPTLIKLQGSLASMSATKKGELYINGKEVDGSKKLKILWPGKNNARASENLFLLTCKLLQGSKKCGDEKNKSYWIL